MNTPHERLIRTSFSLAFGEVHALVGSAVMHAQKITAHAARRS
ncbi:MAG TPA: hypothetical protein VIW07_15145 [Candidatus Udaeobacter sp.]|jgi:hypothetical protein